MLNVILMMGKGGGGIMDVLPLVGILVVFYIFMILPQTRKAKQQKKYREELGKGDKVVTIGGVHGKIVEVNDTTFVIETEGQGRLKIDRSSVSMESTTAAYPKEAPAKEEKK